MIDPTTLKVDSHSTINISGVKLVDLLSTVESAIIKIAMTKCRQNQSLAAKALGISRGTLRTKLKEYFGTEYFRNSN